MAYTQEQINAAYAAEKARDPSLTDAQLQQAGAGYGVTADQFRAASAAFGGGLLSSAQPPAAQPPAAQPSAAVTAATQAPLASTYKAPTTPGYSSSYGWDDGRINTLKSNVYGGGSDDEVAVRNFADTALKSGWGAAETAAIFNRATGANASAADVSRWMESNSLGQLGGNMGLQERLQSDLAAAYHGRNSVEQESYLDAVMASAKKQGLGAGQLGGAVQALTGLGYDGSVMGVDAYAMSRNSPLLRADTNWALEKGVGQLRLDNRDMHLNSMYADEAAAQYGVSSGKALNAMFRAYGLPPLPEREPKPEEAGDVQFAPHLNREIVPEMETVEGRLNRLLGTDERGNFVNPVVRQAVDRAMQQMAGRGLLNSSMAAQAAQEAAIAKAIEIVGPDAERYFQQGRANQDAQNVFARDEQQYRYDLDKMGAQNQYDLDKMAFQSKSDLDKMGSQSKLDMDKMAFQSQLDMSKLTDQQRFELQKLAVTYGYDKQAKEEERKFTALEAEKDREARLKEAGIRASNSQDDNSWRFQLAALEQQARMGNANAEVVANAYGNLMNKEMEISVMDIDDSAKLALLQRQATTFNNLAESKGSNLRAPVYTAIEGSSGSGKGKSSGILTQYQNNSPEG